VPNIRRRSVLLPRRQKDLWMEKRVKSLGNPEKEENIMRVSTTMNKDKGHSL
jgi:hypothetical protein